MKPDVQYLTSLIHVLSFSPSHPMSILELFSLNRELLGFLSETKKLYLDNIYLKFVSKFDHLWNTYNMTQSRDSHIQSFQSVFLFHYLYSVFFPLLLHLKGPFSSSNGCVGSPPHLDIFDMKPVEEAVKSATPFINSSFSSKQRVELFSGKKNDSPCNLFATGDDNANNNVGHVLWFGPIFTFY